MGEMTNNTKERSSSPRLWVISMDHRWWMRYVHGPDKSGSKCGENICDSACHRGVTKWSGFLRVDGQGGDQFKAVEGSTVMEESC